MFTIPQISVYFVPLGKGDILAADNKEIFEKVLPGIQVEKGSIPAFSFPAKPVSNGLYYISAQTLLDGATT